MSGVVDFTALVVGHLSADETVDAVVAGNRLPERTALPACRVTSVQVLPAARPTPEWWNGFVAVDCLATRDVDSFELARTVAGSLQDLVGSHDSAVVADVTQADFQFVDDPDFVPLSSRHLVSVEITARNPTT